MGRSGWVRLALMIVAILVLDEACIILVFILVDKIIVELDSSYLHQQPASCFSPL